MPVEPSRAAIRDEAQGASGHGPERKSSMRRGRSARPWLHDRDHSELPQPRLKVWWADGAVLDAMSHVLPMCAFDGIAHRLYGGVADGVSRDLKAHGRGARDDVAQLLRRRAPYAAA